MGCACNGSNGAQTDKRTVVLRFRRENLDYSIRNYAYVQSHVMGDGRECSKHTLCDVCEDGNRDRVSRLLAVIHSEVIEMLYPFTKHEAVEEVTVDDLWEPKEYVVVMRVPEAFSRTSVHLLNGLIHEFMVYRVLHDWITMVAPEDVAMAAHWKEKAEAAAGEIEKLKNARRGVVRRKLHPW